MVFHWLLRPLRHASRKKLLAEPFPEPWLPFLQRLPFYRHLDERGQQRIRDDLRVLIAEKSWEGCAGLELSDEIRVTIAAQASLLLLNIEHEYYADVESILVYPGSYRTQAHADGSGVVHEGQGNLGEAWRGGPVILSWDSAKRGALDPSDGHNLVFHEFAHKLDLLDGLADGTPPMRDLGEYETWVQTMAREFEALRLAAANRRASLLDKYGATNPAEFFAVATECFFEKSQRLREHHCELYAALRDYYQQDPAAQGSQP